jgi:hypothetical protein
VKSLVFPRLGTFRAEFSKAWKKGGDFFQGLENTAAL